MKRKDYITPEVQVHPLYFVHHLLSHSPGNKGIGDDGDDWTPGAKDNDWDEEDELGGGFSNYPRNVWE